MKNGEQGFTIVELLIAFSIGIMVIIGGIVAGNKFNANQKVDTVISEIEENIRLAKSYAMTRHKPVNYSYSSLGYVQVTLDNAGLMEIMGGNNATGLDNSHKYLSKNIDLSGIVVAQNIGAGVLIFSVPEGKLLRLSGSVSSPVAVGTTVTVQINSSEDVDSKASVTIEDTGLIKSGDVQQ